MGKTFLTGANAADAMRFRLIELVAVRPNWLAKSPL